MASSCVHHWLIESPDGREYLPAACKKCGAEREYPATDKMMDLVAISEVRVEGSKTAVWGGFNRKHAEKRIVDRYKRIKAMNHARKRGKPPPP